MKLMLGEIKVIIVSRRIEKDLFAMLFAFTKRKKLTNTFYRIYILNIRQIYKPISRRNGDLMLELFLKSLMLIFPLVLVVAFGN
jgi:hypothetical protein